jgi:hypothetical protein
LAQQGLELQKSPSGVQLDSHLLVAELHSYPGQQRPLQISPFQEHRSHIPFPALQTSPLQHPTVRHPSLNLVHVEHFPVLPLHVSCSQHPSPQSAPTMEHALQTPDDEHTSPLQQSMPVHCPPIATQDGASQAFVALLQTSPAQQLALVAHISPMIPHSSHLPVLAPQRSPAQQTAPFTHGYVVLAQRSVVL